MGAVRIYGFNDHYEVVNQLRFNWRRKASFSYYLNDSYVFKLWKIKWRTCKGNWIIR